MLIGIEYAKISQSLHIRRDCGGNSPARWFSGHVGAAAALDKLASVSGSGDARIVTQGSAAKLDAHLLAEFLVPLIRSWAIYLARRSDRRLRRCAGAVRLQH